MGIPKTIDNDLMGTDYCLGFETALEVITDIVDKLKNDSRFSSPGFRCRNNGKINGLAGIERWRKLWGLYHFNSRI